MKVYLSYTLKIFLGLFAIFLMVVWPQTDKTFQWLIRLYIIIVAVMNMLVFAVYDAEDIIEEKK